MQLQKPLRMKPEWHFLHYAFPCLDSKIMRGHSILEKHRLELQELMTNKNALIKQGKTPRRSLLRFVFADAYKGIRETAKKIGCQPWDERAIKEYFLKQHNEHVDKAKGRVPESILKHCRIRTGQVTKIQKKGKTIIATIQYPDETTETAIAQFFPNIKTGQTVATHYKTIVDTL